MYFDMCFSPEAVKDLADILGSLDVIELVTPKDLSLLKKDWLARESFSNPTFLYDTELLKKAMDKSELLLAAASRFSDSVYPETDADRVLYRILKKRVMDANSTIVLASAIFHHDDRWAKKAVFERFDCPSEETLSEVSSVLRSGGNAKTLAPDFSPSAVDWLKSDRSYLKDMSFNATEIANNFQFVLDYYGIKGWNIRLDPNCAAINVSEKSSRGEKEIIIPTTREVSGLKLLELIGHELNTHLRGFENASCFFSEVLPSELKPLTAIFAKSGSAVMNEGVAKFSDWSISGDSALPTLYYCEAIRLAISGKSFAEVSEEIYRLKRSRKIKPESARRTTWDVVYRVFRGISNTENLASYAFTKDAAYLMGWLDIVKMSKSFEVPAAEKTAVFDFCSLDREEIKKLLQVFPNLTPKYDRSVIPTVLSLLLL